MKLVLTSRITRQNLTDAQRLPEAWATVDRSLLSSEAALQLFDRRGGAFIDYIRGDRLRAIELKWALPGSEIHRLFGRAMEIHPDDGRPFGFRAFIPGVHVRRYLRLNIDSTRTTVRAGHSGMFTRLLRLHPRIQQRIDSVFLKTAAGLPLKRLPISTIFKVFIKSCRDDGLQASEYPFTVGNLGRASLAHYVRRLFTRDVRAAVAAQYGAEAARRLNIGNGARLTSSVIMPMQRVGFDGHRIHAVFIVRIPRRHGGFVEVILDRPWLLVIIDLATRVVLAWTLSLNPEYTKEDVMKCVRSAVEPSTPPILTTKGLKFDAEGGMPSWVLPEMQWAVWSELSYDNGRANLSDFVRHQIVSTLGGAVNPGPVGTPEHQAIMERLFSLLEAGSWHQMPNTTGNSVGDPRRTDPEKAAKRYGIDLTALTELLAVSVANYNGTPHESLGFRRPLQQLEFFIRQEGVTIRHVSPERRGDIALLSMKILVTVRGNVRKGRRPYVQFERERYSSGVLGHLTDLIGQRIQILVDTEDLRTVRAFRLSGEEIGPLAGLGGWSETKHSLATRRATNRRYRDRILHEANTSNSVVAMMEHLQEKALTSRKAASRYEQIRTDAGLSEDFNPSATAQREEVIDVELAPTPEPDRKPEFFVY